MNAPYTSYEYTGPWRESEAEGHVYVIGFGTTARDVRRIKVGMTQSPDQRVEAIRRTSGWTGLPSSVIWVSPPHAGYRESERLLLEWCVDQYADDYDDWPPIGREWFDGLDPQAVIEHAQTLPMVRRKSA